MSKNQQPNTMTKEQKDVLSAIALIYVGILDQRRRENGCYIEQERRCKNDDLAPAKGLVNGLILSAIMYLAAYAVYRAW